jgi:glycosyltransferase involved in cell wall biosynthesis
MRVMIVDPLFTTLPYDKCLCAALATAGHQVCLVGRPLREGEVWDLPSVQHIHLNIADLFEPSALSPFRLRVLSAWRHLRYSLKIQSIGALARKWRPDVIHFQWCLTPAAELFLLRRLRHGPRLVYTVHDTVPFNGSKVSSFMTSGLDSLILGFDRLIVHTETAKKVLVAQGLSPETIVTVPHGPLGPRANRTGGPPPVAARRDHQKVHFLLFGIMKRYKGIDVLIAAAGLLPKSVQDKCRFIIAGKPAIELEGLRDLCRNARVEELFEFDARHIPDEELDRMLEGADVFLFPYRKIEASGVFTIALQYGRPFIASSIGVFKEQLMDGCHGFLVEPESPTELANAITRIVLEPKLRRNMGKNVERMSMDLPNWGEISAATEEVYDEIISTH